MTGIELLTRTRKINHDEAIKKAHEEYEKFCIHQLEQPTAVEKHFIEAEKELQQLESKLKQISLQKIKKTGRLKHLEFSN